MLSTAFPCALDLVQRIVQFELQRLAVFLQQSDLGIQMLGLGTHLTFARFQVVVFFPQLRDLRRQLVFAFREFQALLIGIDHLGVHILDVLGERRDA